MNGSTAAAITSWPTSGSSGPARDPRLSRVFDPRSLSGRKKNGTDASRSRFVSGAFTSRCLGTFEAEGSDRIRRLHAVAARRGSYDLSTSEVHDAISRHLHALAQVALERSDVHDDAVTPDRYHVTRNRRAAREGNGPAGGVGRRGHSIGEERAVALLRHGLHVPR